MRRPDLPWGHLPTQQGAGVLTGVLPMLQVHLTVLFFLLRGSIVLGGIAGHASHVPLGTGVDAANPRVDRVLLAMDVIASANSALAKITPEIIEDSQQVLKLSEI